jgi:hypothetical protein
MHPIEQYFKFDLPKAPDMRLAALLQEALLENTLIESQQPLIYEVVQTLVPPRNVNALPEEEQDEYAAYWHECYKSVKQEVVRLAAERWLKLQPE